MSGYLKTASGHPVQHAAAVPRHATEFVLGSHLGVILEVYDESGLGVASGAQAPILPAGTRRPGLTAQVLIIDDGRRAPYQVVEGVVVCAGAPLGAASATRVRPSPTSARILGPERRTELRDTGRLAEDVPLEALDGDWCIVSYLGGNEARPFISAYWPSPGQEPRQGPPAAFEARHAGLSVRVDDRGSLELSTEHSGELLPSVGPDDPGGGPIVPLTGGDIDVRLKPGRHVTISIGGEAVMTVAHDGTRPVLVLGEDATERSVLGDALIAFFNDFRARLLAKLAAIEDQFARFYAQEYAVHQHGVGPGGTTPPAQPAPDPMRATFQAAEPQPPPPMVPGTAPGEPAHTSPDRRTDERSLPRMRSYRLLSGSVRLPRG